MTVLPTLAGAVNGSAIGTTERGEVVGGNILGTGEQHAVLWTDGRILDLGPGQALGYDEQGQVLIESVDSTGHLVRFISDHGRRLTLPAGVTDIAGLSLDGQVYGTYQPAGSTNQHGFLLRRGTLIDLGGFSPNAVNACGQVLGTINGGGAGVWFRSQTTALVPVSSRGDAHPVAINDRGLVAGTSGFDTATVWQVPAR